MTLQAFADRISEIVWGGERGWIGENGLEKLADAVLQMKNNADSLKQARELALFVAENNEMIRKQHRKQEAEE